jgi:hypothetical protein
MKLRQINSNCHELITNKGTILFSYETPVAVSFDIAIGEKWGCYKSDEKFSKTTSKHINAFTDTRRAVPQNEIYAYAAEILRAV